MTAKAQQRNRQADNAKKGRKSQKGPNFRGLYCKNRLFLQKGAIIKIKPTRVATDRFAKDVIYSI